MLGASYRLLMPNYVSRFPDGAAGLGLLLARMCYAAAAFGVVAILAPPPALRHMLPVAAGCVALMLVAGLATRWAALLLGVGILFALPAFGVAQQLLLAGHVGGCGAIVLLGAGAYSVDARRYGRRVMHVHTHTPDRGGDH